MGPTGVEGEIGAGLGLGGTGTGTRTETRTGACSRDGGEILILGGDIGEGEVDVSIDRDVDIDITVLIRVLDPISQYPNILIKHLDINQQTNN